MLKTYGGGSTGAQKTALGEVETAARERLNLMLRDQGKSPYQPTEPIPALYILIEALHHTKEPVRTYALRAMEYATVPFCVSIPINVLFGQTLAQWMPWDCSPKPVPKIISCLKQIATWKFEIVPQLNNFGVMDSVLLDPNKKPKVSHKAFAEAPADLPDKFDDIASNYKISVDHRSVNAAVTVDFDPKTGVSYEDQVEDPLETNKAGAIPSDADPNFVSSMSSVVEGAESAGPAAPTTTAPPPPPAAPQELGHSGGR